MTQPADPAAESHVSPGPASDPTNSPAEEASSTSGPFIPGQTPAMVRAALTRYRVMAYLVGTLLVVLVVVGLPLKYIWYDGTVVKWTGMPHGWLYMVLLATAYDLGRRVRWTWRRMILIGLAGTVPFLSFVAERSATQDVRDKLASASNDTGDAPQ